MIVRNTVIFTILITVNNALFVEEYLENRSKILNKEFSYSLGGNIQLSEEEMEVNDTIMKLKHEELKNTEETGNFIFSKTFYAFKDYINASKLYQIIKKMPKGGALHVHSLFILDAEYLLNLTYEDHLYGCYEEDEIFLYFAENVQTLKQSIRAKRCSSDWTLMSELREASDNVTQFDIKLKEQFSLFHENKENEKNTDQLWNRFMKIDGFTRALITYRPVREKYIYDSLKKIYDDNVMYVELRSGFNILYELNGTEHEPFYMIKLYEEVTKKFIEDYPDFIGVKLIMTTGRAADAENLKNFIDLVKDAKKEFPLMVAGSDLVGQEDKGKPLTEFLPQLLEAKDSLDFYFHAGETNWSGTASDENLIDAILLGTKRIGHGFALAKHPVLMSMVLRQDIAVEVNVVSNAALALVGDVRAHPLATFLALGLPVLLSSDDPGVWGAAPLSHDFYIAFVAVASRHADLRLLKQLALNSIKYSALDVGGKERFYNVFERRWREFLQDVLTYYPELVKK